MKKRKKNKNAAFSFIEILLVLLVIAVIGVGGFWVKDWSEQNLYSRMQAQETSESAVFLAELSAMKSTADFLLLERGSSPFAPLDDNLAALQKTLDRKLSPETHALKADNTSVYVGLKLPSKEAASRLPGDGSLYYTYVLIMPGEEDRVPPKKKSFPGWVFRKVR